MKKSKPAAPAAARELDLALRQARGLRAQNQREQALTVLQALLAQAPGAWEAHTLLGECQAELGNWAEALAAFEAALTLRPKQALLQARAGEAAAHLGAWSRAEQAYAAALALDATMAAAWRNLGLARRHQARLQPAFEAYYKAWTLEPNHPETRRSLAYLFAQPELYCAPICNKPQPWKNLLKTLLQDPGQWHQGLAPVAAAQILAHAPGDKLHKPERDELLLGLLTQAINVSLPLESRLRALRTELLEAVATGTAPAPLNLIAALALQTFYNEALWPETSAETLLLERWSDHFSADNPAEVLAYAMYRPLHTRPDAVGLLRAPCWQAGLENLRTRLLAEPLEERLLAAAMPSLTAIQDATSRAVQDQYEEHPFPRWTNLAAVLPSLPETYRNAFQSQPPAHLAGPLEVLIAGCGTGQHPISVALANPQAQVSAIDLSRASLAFGQRMAKRMNVANLSFAQADLLELGAWARRFDHIESVGVLHHMADPLAGWRVLRQLLRPGGTMRIGLYSEHARQGVVAARALIAREGLRGDLAGIRQLRERIVGEEALQPLREQLLGLDFFATSTLRDLIFHVSEQRYTPLRLRDELATLGLRFLGFELNAAPARQAYAARFPDDPQALDLVRWDQIEAEHPSTFSGMFILWATPI